MQLVAWNRTFVALLLGTLTTIVSPAQTFSTLANFDTANGADPFLMSLVQGRDGAFYGTTRYGGANNQGTVFKITRAGKLTSLYSFWSNTDCSDGGYPAAGLVLATDGNFYGTTE